MAAEKRRITRRRAWHGIVLAAMLGSSVVVVVALALAALWTVT